jgi:pantetheine-phosphate adenylyltransferase
MFSAEDRIAMLEAEAGPLARKAGASVRVVTFDNLVVDAARRHGASVIIRGLRDGTDLDYEMQMSGMNGTMAPELRTVFLPASPAVRHITATLVRQIAAMGGDVSAFVSPRVAKRLAAHARKKM